MSARARTSHASSRWKGTRAMFEERSEDMLMARYADGDDRALDALFDRLAPRLLAFLRCSPSEVERAEQLLQSTFVQLHRSRDAYPRGSSARAWIFGIAANMQRKPVRRLRWPRRGVRAVFARSTDNQRDQEVREAIAGLQEADQQLLHLHRVEGLSFEQIAQIMGVSEAEIRVRTISAYRQLRERLLWLVSDGGRS